LKIAGDLLSDDGAIFVQIDYHEVAYLNVLLNEIFGRDNFGYYSGTPFPLSLKSP